MSVALPVKPVSLESIGLPSARSAVSNRWVDQQILIYGQTKVGKTKFVAQDERAFFVRTERGHNHVENFGVDCRTYDEVMDVLNKLVQAKKIEPYPYSIVCIDTFDRIVEYSEDAVLDWARNKFKNIEINSVGDVPNGAGWAERTSRINGVFRKMEELHGYCALAVIMHMAVDDREDEKGKFKIETVNVGGKSNKIITGWADHTMAVKSIYVGDQLLRKVKLRPTRNLDAGSRGILPEELAWGSDDKKNWETFRAYFK